MKPILPLALAVVLSAGTTHAGVIAGPAMTSWDNAYQYSGLGFTATVNSTLVSFVFQNQGLADNVVLVDPSGDILNEASIPSGNSSYTVLADWSLTAGTQYYLLQTTWDNGRFTMWLSAPPYDAEIALTDTGDWSNFDPDAPDANPLASANFIIGGGGDNYTPTTFWADFNNITTSSSVPEPASLILVLPFAALLLHRKLRDYPTTTCRRSKSEWCRRWGHPKESHGTPRFLGIARRTHGRRHQ